MDPTTTARDPQVLRRGWLDQGKINVLADPAKAHLSLRWKTSAVSELDVVWRVPANAPGRIDKDTIGLMRRLAVHHSDTFVASALNRQGKKTATNESFTASCQASLRQRWKIPRDQASGELHAIGTAADPLGPADSVPMPDGQIYRGRASCSVCFRVHSNDQSTQRCARGQSAARLCLHARSDAPSWRVTQNDPATCKAQRPSRSAHEPHQTQDIAHQHFKRKTATFRLTFNSDCVV